MPASALTPVQERALAKLRSQHATWAWMRWVWLVVGLACSVLGVVVARNLIETLAQAVDQEKVTGFQVYLASMTAYGVTLCWLLSAAGVIMAVLALGRWRGRPQIVLLLALLEPGETAP